MIIISVEMGAHSTYFSFQSIHPLFYFVALEHASLPLPVVQVVRQHFTLRIHYISLNVLQSQISWVLNLIMREVLQILHFMLHVKILLHHFLLLFFVARLLLIFIFSVKTEVRNYLRTVILKLHEIEVLLFVASQIMQLFVFIFRFLYGREPVR